MFNQLSDSLDNVFRKLKGQGKISEKNISDALRQVRMALLEADVDYGVTKGFIAAVKEKALGVEVTKSVKPGQQIVKIFHDELTYELCARNRNLYILHEVVTIELTEFGPAGNRLARSPICQELRKGVAHCRARLLLTGSALCTARRQRSLCESRSAKLRLGSRKCVVMALACATVGQLAYVGQANSMQVPAENEPEVVG